MSTHGEKYKNFLADTLVAIERCVYFLNAACLKVKWPLTGNTLANRNKEVELFMALSTINERFAKLQDTLGAAMRHATLLAGEQSENFLRVLSYFEKVGVLSSISDWQEMRALRNIAAHEYGTDYAEIAEHFNALHSLIPRLYSISKSFIVYCHDTLAIEPSNSDFSDDFKKIVDTYN